MRLLSQLFPAYYCGSHAKGIKSKFGRDCRCLVQVAVAVIAGPGNLIVNDRCRAIPHGRRKRPDLRWRDAQDCAFLPRAIHLPRAGAMVSALLPSARRVERDLLPRPDESAATMPASIPMHGV